MPLVGGGGGPAWHKASMMSRSRPESVTIRDVAAAAGVSPITASRALSGSKQVRQETRRRVEAAAEALGYIPNFAAGMLSSRESKMIAVVVPNFAHSIFATTLQEIGDGVRGQGYQLLIGCSDYSDEREEELVRTFLSRGADAIVLTGHLHTQATREMVVKSGKPVIEMWSLGAAPLGMSVGVSNYRAALTATRHLLSIGRRRIAYIGGDLAGNDRAQARIDGYRAALAEAGIAADPALERTGPFEFETGSRAVEDMLRQAPDIDAIFAASDIIALGALLQCGQSGIAVPERIAICGFDDAPVAQLIRPALTTVMFPKREIGRLVAENLLAMLGGTAPGERVVEVDFSLVVRETA